MARRDAAKEAQTDVTEPGLANFGARVASGGAGRFYFRLCRTNLDQTRHRRGHSLVTGLRIRVLNFPDEPRSVP